MGKLIWTEQFNVGIEVIDQQHRKIVEYLNQLDDINSRVHSNMEIGNLINALIDHTIHHFNFEEKIQQEVGYPYIKAHQRLHVQFAKRLANFQTRFAEGEDISGELESYLTNWLLDHLKHDDTDYAELAKQHLQAQPDFQKQNKGIFARLFG
ncbi:bacteriohemerythrin [Sideroxydans sp. CL21]|uniref:bacteriohemerythrin n=1 Tax=Sideroxydans sp. CL21 TaxID=2600596 RepID=UPI0024BC6A2D|nr:bacteriohemerythrin [Sideroxydans sp. CL21]